MVAEHHARSADEYLAVGCDLELDVREGPPDGTEPVFCLSIRRGSGGQLGHAPALQDLDAQAPEELLHLLTQGSAATDEERNLPPVSRRRTLARISRSARTFRSRATPARPPCAGVPSTGSERP